MLANTQIIVTELLGRKESKKSNPKLCASESWILNKPIDSRLKGVGWYLFALGS